jgi:hypothetical protein
MTRMLALAAAIVALAPRTIDAQTQPATPAPATAPSAAAPPAAAPQAAPADPAAPAPQAEPAPAPPAPTQPAPAAAPPPPPPPQAAAATAPPPKPPSRRGTLYTWGSVGTTFAYDNTYASANLGVGYIMKLGITPNVELSYAFGSDPNVWSLRPGVTWFMPVPMLSPYVGAYYARWFVSGLDDRNGVGGRAGISLGRLLSLGVTYERALDCDRNCDVWSPQISAGLSL